MPEHMKETLEIIKQSGLFSEFDIQFALFIVRNSDYKPKELFWTALFLSHKCAGGHICVNLKSLAKKDYRDIEELIPSTLFNFKQLLPLLQSCSVTGKIGEYTPFILEENLLYFQKYWTYENFIAQSLIKLSKQTRQFTNTQDITHLLDKIFPETTDEINWQRIAASVAMSRQLCIISGGPGTGKTTAVAGIISILATLNKSRPLRIAMAAPTGKAAMRINEAIDNIKIKNPSMYLPNLPEATTIHRLLKPTRKAPFFTYHKENPLPLDLLIIDEASMIDITLMYHILDAIPEHIQLIMLGDHEQLASVKAGSVLGDICNPNRLSTFSPSFIKTIISPCLSQPLSENCHSQSDIPLTDCIISLKNSYRFKGRISSCSIAVKDGKSEEAFRICSNLNDNSISWHDISETKNMPLVFEQEIVEKWQEYLMAFLLEDKFQKLTEFRTLCVLRSGYFGVEQINTTIESILNKAGLLTPSIRWYENLPILITRNDYQMKLYNGDTGIFMPDKDDQGRLKAWFPDGAHNNRQTFRSIAPSRLPDFEKAFAITIHKSQGTEFDSIQIILPDTISPILKREILYTGITRAKNHVSLYGSEAIFKHAIKTRTNRESGLRKKLWGITKYIV